MSNITIKKVGITNVGTECIVNAANENLWAGGGVCGVIFNAAGIKELSAACQAIGHCDTGSAVITPAFDLNAKYIIHAVGPIYKDGHHKEPQQLYGCYKRSLELAKEYQCHSIGFPLISAGIFGYPVDKAWRKAIQACQDFINNNQQYEMNIVFAVIDDQILKIGNQTLLNLSHKNHQSKTIHSSYMNKEELELLQGIDIEKLKQGIEYFCHYKKVEWNGGEIIGKTEEGKNIVTWPHPGYTKECLDYVNILPPDLKYSDHYNKYCENVLPTSMNARQIRTYMTWIMRGEHFCDGFLARYIENGTILKLLLRLDDLIQEMEYKKKETK